MMMMMVVDDEEEDHGGDSCGIENNHATRGQQAQCIMMMK